ncbi:NADP-dependent oxidoreductase domain-containing protein [Ilyonectria destructans]|nr:NADP-dependent oxidoreductase domain-containing protein [Ilyonectria destructans]
MSANGIKIVFGGGAFFGSSADDVVEWLKTLEEVGIKVIDTAQAYGASEETLGNTGAALKFTIDTKLPSGFGPQPSTKDLVINSCKESLQKLKTDNVDVYYLHAPDRRVPWKETLSGLDELHQQGAFKRLGLSNFLGQEVEEIIQVAKEKNFVVPSVYQGNYSAVARRADEEIFPTLRKHNISFYAYSPIAGGFLSKSKAALTDTEGRFSKDNPFANIYNAMYNRPSFMAALDVWEQIAKDERVTKAELAYRWVVYHSKLRGDLGDAVIVGARKDQQLRETVEAIKNGPLSEGTVRRIDEIWESVKAEAALDNFEVMGKR